MRHLMGILTLAASALTLAAAPTLAQPPDDIFKRLDRNADGKISKDEVPERARPIFDRIDTDKDGFITLEEHNAFRQARAGGGGRRPQPGKRPNLPAPDHADVKYGPHERNVLDIWLAKSAEPTPLVIFYHGGGFRHGDKRTLNVAMLSKLREGGVSVAAANYRLTDVAPFPAQMHDCARALQFLRHHAADYNLNPARVGATGGSAGAGISLWLAFHEDLADPKSDDSIARESTRLSCAVVFAAQSSYDPRFHRELFKTDQIDQAMIAFYGMSGPGDIDNPEFQALFEEASSINHATADDPPVFLYYPQANDPLPPNAGGKQYIHHPKFGFVLKEKLYALGIECVLKLREDYGREAGRGGPLEEYVAFFFDKLGVAKAGVEGEE